MTSIRRLAVLAHSRLTTFSGTAREALRREDGQGLVEYALIASLIAVAVFGALRLTGTSLTGLFNQTAGDV